MDRSNSVVVSACHKANVFNEINSGNALQNILPLHVKNLIYFSLFHSRLTYLTEIWGNATWSTLSQLQILQNSCLRHVYGLPRLTNKIEMYRDVAKCALPIQGIAQFQTLIYVFKVLHGMLLSNVNFVHSEHGHNTRARFLVRPHATNNFGTRRILYWGSALFNGLPVEIETLQSL